MGSSQIQGKLNQILVFHFADRRPSTVSLETNLSYLNNIFTVKLCPH